MPGTRHDDGPDTALARLLAASGRLPVPDLRAALDHVRSDRGAGGPRLADLLVERGLIDPAELEATYVSALRRSDGSFAPAPSGLDEPEQRLGRYVILEELGRGGMGVVFKAFDPQTGEVVAIKKILGSVGPDELLRFEREAQIMRRLDHPGIAGMREVVSRGPNAPYLVIDFVEGVTLRSRTRNGPIPAREAAEILLGIARAIGAAHELNVVHRDLKPDNVMLTPAGPVVLDFGLARRVIDESVPATLSGEVLGTPSYMAPEQAVAGTTDARTDVYGLGAILYECLTGELPFTGSFAQVMRDVVLRRPDPPSRRVPETPPVLEAICLRCLRKQPAERYPTAAALAKDLQTSLAAAQISEGLGRVAVPAHLEIDPASQQLRRVGAAALGVLAVLIAVFSIAGTWTAGTADPVADPTPQPSTAASTPSVPPDSEAAVKLAYARRRALTRAHEMVRTRTPTKALLRELLPLLQRSPAPSAAILTEAGLLLLSAGAGAEAESCLAQAVERDPRALQPLYWLDVLRPGAGGTAKLRRRAEEAGGAQHPLALVARARLATSSGDPDAAIPLAQRALADRPRLAPALRELGLACLAKHDPKAALADLQRSSAVTPAWITRHQIGVILLDLGRAVEAEEVFGELLSRIPTDVPALIERGRARLAQKRYAESRRDLDQAIALGPSHPERYRAHDARGMLLREERRAPDAVPDHRVVLRLAPTRAHAERGRAHLGLGELDAAARAFAAMIRDEPNRVDGYEGRAMIRVQQGRVRDALPDIDAWIRLRPADANPLIQRSQLYTQLNQHEAAKRDLDRVIRLVPDQPEGFYLRGAWYVRQRNKPAALVDWRRAWRLAPPGSRIRRILKRFEPELIR